MGPPLLARVEAQIGRLLYSSRARDAKLLPRSVPAIYSLSPTITVTSPCGATSSPLLLEHTPIGSNKFPGLSWLLPADLPAEQIAGYLLIVEDPDAPLPDPVVHGLYYDIPAGKSTLAPEDFVVAKETGEGGALAGGFRYGANRMHSVWGGPKPVLGHGEHSYFFQLVALKANLDLKSKGTKPLAKKDLLHGALDDGKVAAWGEWVGVFERQP